MEEFSNQTTGSNASNATELFYYVRFADWLNFAIELSRQF
jgi:hypothetical protein